MISAYATASGSRTGCAGCPRRVLSRTSGSAGDLTEARPRGISGAPSTLRATAGCHTARVHHAWRSAHRPRRYAGRSRARRERAGDGPRRPANRGRCYDWRLLRFLALPRAAGESAMPILLRGRAVRVLSLSLMLDLAGCQGPPAIPEAAHPAVTVDRPPGARHAIVASANPLATEAGLATLRAGGSAADAAVAMQAVLGLVEPQSSGLGGGTFISYYDVTTRRVSAYNGREFAPAGAGPDLFLGPDGRPPPFISAVLSGRSTGVPGAVAALALLQHEHGRLPWRTLFARAEQLAREGFTVSPRLAGMIAGPAPQAASDDARRYFTKADGARYAAGDRLRNAAYADTVHRLAFEGPDALYHGPIARDIVQRVHEGELPGTLSLDDLASYRAVKSTALCRPWRIYVVCGPPPPAGTISVLEGLLLLEHTDIARRGPGDPLAWVQLGAAERLLYADRNRYLGDPDFVAVPTAGLLDPGYLRDRAALISTRIEPTSTPPGRPPG